MSYATQIFYVAGLQAFASLAYYSPPMAALFPVLLSPTLLAVWRYRRLSREEAGSSKVATWTYLGTGLLGLPVAGIIQWGLCTAMFKALFGARASDYMEELQRITLDHVPEYIIRARQQMAWSPRYFLALTTLSYLGAAVVEEAIKYFALRLAVRRARPRHEHEYLVYAALAGLGFGTLENILVTYESISENVTSGMLALTVFERIIFASFGHTIMALLTGLQSIRRDARGEKLSIWRVLAKAVAVHGTSNFILLSVSAWHGNVGWIHPTDTGSIVFALTSVIALQVKAAWDISKQFKELQLRACK
jgi:RsiW-degrading membrane proteinase PrsW (M82 family)